MAHAVSGSAYSAKGGNLKFADVVRERFRGPAFGQDFTTWLDEVLLGFETANISESSQVTHLVAFLESPNREIAVAYLKKWKEENPHMDYKLFVKAVEQQMQLSLKEFHSERSHYLYYKNLSILL